MIVAVSDEQMVRLDYNTKILHRDTIQHDYSLRSGRSRSLTPKLNTKRFSEFVTIKFRNYVV